MKLSIIVPMYNSTDTIERCIESIIKQKASFNYEVIIVNDGSIDDSCKKVKKYIDTNNNIKLIDKSNGGVSSARNAGLNLATGEYIWFVDSDDIIKSNAIVKLEKYMEEDVDIIKFNYVVEKLPGIYLKRAPKIKNNIGENFLKTYSMNSPCTQIFKRELAKKNNIIFNEQICYGEDYLFNLPLYTNASNIILTNEYIYIYKKTKNSITRVNNIKSITKKINDAIFVYTRLYLYCDKLKIDNEKILKRVSNELIEILKTLDLQKGIDILNKIETENKIKMKVILNNKFIIKLKIEREKYKIKQLIKGMIK